MEARAICFAQDQVDVVLFISLSNPICMPTDNLEALPELNREDTAKMRGYGGQLAGTRFVWFEARTLLK